MIKGNDFLAIVIKIAFCQQIPWTLQRTLHKIRTYEFNGCLTFDYPQNCIWPMAAYPRPLKQHVLQLFSSCLCTANWVKSAGNDISWPTVHTAPRTKCSWSERRVPGLCTSAAPKHPWHLTGTGLEVSV